MSFAFHFISTERPSFQPALQAISANDDQILKPANRWGAFFGLFGLASNEFFLVTCGDIAGAEDRLKAVDGVTSVHTISLQPTVRPTDETPRSREGLYVFRFFGVHSRDIDEIAQLSKEAWTYFETSDRYKAEPQALFCETDRDKDEGIMLLITWYDGLNSWQESRAPEAQARENFRKRSSMTTFTKPFATRLIV